MNLNLVRRRAAVAGSFYPRFKPDLLRSIEESFKDTKFGPGKLPECQNLTNRIIIGGISPHAGYVYSGCCAAHTYYNLFREKVPETIVILGTDHLGYGKIAIMKEGAWETPFGDLAIDEELAKNVVTTSSYIVEDESAFIGYPFGREHNIEVQLPFIKYCSQDSDLKILPIKVSTKSYDVVQQIAKDIRQSITNLNKDIVIVASSDMTHKQPRNFREPAKDLMDMENKDKAVIKAFEEFDCQKTFKSALNTSVCGPQTITTLMLICKNLGATKTEALKYYTSYQKGGGTGPCEYSVGYFSGIILT